MVIVQKSALVLTILGAIHLGIFGVFGVDTMDLMAGGSDTMLAKTIFILMGLAGLINIGLFFMTINERA